MIELLDVPALSAFKLDLLLLVSRTFCALPKSSFSKTLFMQEKKACLENKSIWCGQFLPPLSIFPEFLPLSAMYLFSYCFLAPFCSCTSQYLPLPSLFSICSCCPAFRCFHPTGDPPFSSYHILKYQKTWVLLVLVVLLLAYHNALLLLSLFFYCFHILCLSNLLHELFQGRNHFSKAYWKLR